MLLSPPDRFQREKSCSFAFFKKTTRCVCEWKGERGGRPVIGIQISSGGPADGFWVLKLLIFSSSSFFPSSHTLTNRHAIDFSSSLTCMYGMCTCMCVSITLTMFMDFWLNQTHQVPSHNYCVIMIFLPYSTNEPP